MAPATDVEAPSTWDQLKTLAIQPLVEAADLHDSLSRGILATADRIDAFFGDERMAADANGTYLQLDG